MADLPLTLTKTFSTAVASNGTLSGELDLGGVWERVFMENPAPGAAVKLLASRSSGGTFYAVGYPNTSSAQAFEVGSATSAGIVEVPVAGLRYVKVRVTATAANGASFAFICS